MKTPFEEGQTAGYRNESRANPYKRGWCRAFVTSDALEEWANEWERGYDEGKAQAHDDLIDRRIEATR